MNELEKVLSEFEDTRLYDVNILSETLKSLGIPYNKATIKKYGEKGELNIGRLPNTQKMVFLGSEIKRFIKNYLKETGVI